jgi:hypothetical protein
MTSEASMIHGAQPSALFDHFLESNSIEAEGIAGYKGARALDGATVPLPALGFGVVLLADALLDDLIDRLKSTAGNLLHDQALGFGAELYGHGCASPSQYDAN